MSYALLVLPDEDWIDPAVLRKIRELVREGATVLGPRPVRTGGLAGSPAADEEVRAIADAIHGAIVDVYGIPVRDRFQMITEQPPSQIIAEDAGLGFERTDGVVMIQIFTQRGRSDEAKNSLYARIHQALADVGVLSEDVFIGYVENGPQDWSFGFGRAQYLTGELGLPPLTCALAAC